MNLKKKCKNSQYASLIIRICQMKYSCKYCVLNEQKCRYHCDNRNAIKNEQGFEYCFDHVRAWVSDNGFNDYYTVSGEFYDDDVYGI